MEDARDHQGARAHPHDTGNTPMRNLIAILFLLSLAGCVTAQDREAAAAEFRAKLAQQDDQSCRSYGATPGSQSYITCRTALQAARFSAPPPVNVSVAAAPGAPVIQQPMTTTCLRTGAMTSCNSM
jgi:hypothetical protein